MTPAKKVTSNPKKTKSKAGGNELQTVKGMHDLVGEEVFLYQGFAEKAAEIALYYGFKPIETPILEKRELFDRGVGDSTDIVGKEMYALKTKGGDHLAMRPEGTAPIMRAYLEHGMQAEPQPVMLYYYGPFFRHENPQRGRLREFRQFGFEILGTKKSVADATIIKLTLLILEETGLKNLCVKVNSIGDESCRANFRRELINYYKKHSRSICPDCRERLKTNPLRLLDCKNEKCQEIKKDAPESVSFLCGECKSHFKEVLEYLDMMKIEYEIDSSLVRGLDYYSRTVFEIVQNTEEEKTDDKEQEEGKEEEKEKEEKKEVVKAPALALAGGGRYDYLSKMLASKKEIPAVGASIGVDRVVHLPDYAKLDPRIVKKPKVFFIQLSFDAKLKSFEVTEILRKAKVPVSHSMSKDSLSAQLGIAERLKVPFTIILGQKEALDNTVIVRNMDTRSQDIVPMDKLADYIKKIK